GPDLRHAVVQGLRHRGVRSGFEAPGPQRGEVRVQHEPFVVAQLEQEMPGGCGVVVVDRGRLGVADPDHQRPRPPAPHHDVEADGRRRVDLTVGDLDRRPSRYANLQWYVVALV